MVDQGDLPPDNRSLFEKLQQQKAAKEEAFQEANRFSSLIRRLDNDEVDFLADVQEQKQREESMKRRRTEQALSDFRAAQRKEDARLAALEDERRTKQGPRSVKPPVIIAPRKRQGITGVIKRDRKKAKSETIAIDSGSIASMNADESAKKTADVSAMPSDKPEEPLDPLSDTSKT
ncbi:N-terminal domain of NEFA-interacting nuclear protein NIP30-domain-containing protein [Protomyces lactucae-debilis]|uniref:N-terminal domain of NEFA-interacting nuclear protein NIP30-domain-containing protein n=1 Tax=Protomyces lactucae-debilis TaxID=2754530 RepID=A0A1Y2EWE7_PROLT|nr:N-terminal domain of NEFA-interacting nuclear protein NIP30-domain-containing protein [Protomyces lactucae-debilis]ORY75145.1 N-terminal domain of NEFA-interacting nuclear protein NIP30-domain-containing protein [Protomyces lactucae-debilis]